MRKITRSRRQIIKNVSAALAGTAVTAGVSSAQDSGRASTKSEVLETAEWILEKTGSPRRYQQYLANNGFTVSTVAQRYTPTMTDGPVPQYLDKADLQISLTLGYDAACAASNDSSPLTPGNPSVTQDFKQPHYANLWWSWKWQDWDDWGEGPDDIVSIAFSDDDWFIPEDGRIQTSDSDVNYKKSSPSGIAFEYNDVTGNYGSKWVNVELLPDGPSDPRARQVFADYIHTYSGNKVKSVTFSSSGDVSVSISGSSGQWHTDTDENGDRLVTSEAAAPCGE